MIERLEDVHAEKYTWPGALEFGSDPIYQLLTREGEAAVAPLLDVYEDDQRLTRTYEYGRPWHIERDPIPVNHVAKLILSDILRTPKLVERSTPAELRVWWEKHKTSSPMDRSFELLADDHAGPEAWLESADLITLRSDVKITDGQRITREGNCSPKKPPPPPYGEELRTRRGPSVSELLARRTGMLAASAQSASCRMAFMAFLWDPTVSLPVLKTAGNLEACRGDSLVAAARISQGDARAAAEWTEAIKNRVSKHGFRVSELSPLWMFPDNPVLVGASEWLFSLPESPLSPGVEYYKVHSPLLAVPAYRRAVALALSDNSVVETQERRVKDMVARELSQLDGAPRFDLDSAESDKDAAIRNIAEFLTMHENEVRAFPAKPQDTSCPREYVYLAQ